MVRVLDTVSKLHCFFPPTRILLTALDNRITIRQELVPVATFDVDFYNFPLIISLGRISCGAEVRNHVPGYSTQWRTVPYYKALMSRGYDHR
jgi:hypothetical protein